MNANHRLQQAINNGIEIPKDGDWGDVPSKTCGKYGGSVEGNTMNNDVESFENKLKSENNHN